MNEQAGRRADGQTKGAGRAPGYRTDIRENGRPRPAARLGRAPSNFRQMLLWRKAQDLALIASKICDDLPRKPASQAIGNQLVRAAGSVPANIAEGYGRFSQPAYRHHLSIARGSCFEVESWVDLLLRRHDVSQEIGDEAIGLCVEAQKLLTRRMQSSGNDTYAVRDEESEYKA